MLRRSIRTDGAQHFGQQQWLESKLIRYPQRLSTLHWIHLYEFRKFDQLTEIQRHIGEGG